MYVFQSESTLYSCLNVWLNGWVFVYEVSGCGFESSCCHLNKSIVTFKETEAVSRRCCVKKVSLKIRKVHKKAPQAYNYIKKEAVTQVFSSELCEVFKKLRGGKTITIFFCSFCIAIT